MINRIYILILLLLVLTLNAQDHKDKPLQFFGDFRFRVEHDWDSQKADGTYRDDRSRLRYRFRLGSKYTFKDWAEVGARIRTGNLNDQQGPHVTLGGSNGEFSIIQMGFEKLYFKAYYKHISGWIGKNVFPFYKQNELFWNDNVFPDGVALQYAVPIQSNTLSDLTINAGHFIIASNNETFDKDSYFDGLQLVSKFFGNTLKLYPGFFYFHQVADIPDGKGTFALDYKLLNAGLELAVLSRDRARIGLDFYKNFEELSKNEDVPLDFADQRTGYVVSIKLGKFSEANRWIFHLYYAYLEKYAIVDYFAQNDWARWDYSSVDATGSRLSNMKGFELKIGYAFNKKLNLIFRGYLVEQIKNEGAFAETGSRARLDLNFRF